MLNWEKCHFMVTEENVLGHKISHARLEVDRAKINVVIEISTALSFETIEKLFGTFWVLSKIHQRIFQNS